jgi:hypothetical protein
MCYTELCDQRGGRFVSLELSDFAHLHDAYLCRTIPTLPVGTGRCRQPEPACPWACPGDPGRLQLLPGPGRGRGRQSPAGRDSARRCGHDLCVSPTGTCR